MFVRFFYLLKKEGVPVSITEWMTLMEALGKGLAAANLTSFYYLARSILVKRETHYDKYDLAFQKYFEGIESADQVAGQVYEWIEKSLPTPADIDLKDLPGLGLSESDLVQLKKQYEETVVDQPNRRRQGSQAIGTGGTSPFGHSGRYNLGGIRMGGQSQSRSAVKVAGDRKYREFRGDEVLGVRQFQVALKKLRLLTTRMDGPLDRVDLDETIGATSKNGGNLKLVWTRQPKNNFRIILLMDSGGSMMPHYELCNRLFTAVNKANHFKSLEIYYFHNCVYHQVYKDAFLQEPVRTDVLIRNRRTDTKLIFVGDASMAPSELTQKNGIIDWGMTNDDPGLLWLQRLARRFSSSVWLNPVPVAQWASSGFTSIQLVREVFPMFELTVDGLEQAVRQLKMRR